MKNSLSRLLSGSTLFLVTLGFLGATPTTADAFTGSGAGTTGDPYQITTCVQLQEMNDGLFAYYKLMNNVDCDAATHVGGALWNDGAGFTHIGSINSRFAGDFNGNSKVINGIFINPSMQGNYSGLFAFLDSGSHVYNVGVENIEITTSSGINGIGGLAGVSEGIITNCYTTGIISTNGTHIGGLIGTVNGGSVTNSYSMVTLNTTGNYVGGLEGYGGGSITNSYSTGTVNASGQYVGGLVGIGMASITNSFWDTETSGQLTSGGGWDGGTGKTTAEMNTQSTFSTWDFDVDNWHNLDSNNNGYPYLSWQTFGGAGVPEFSTYMMILTLLAGAWMVNKKMIESRVF